MNSYLLYFAPPAPFPPFKAARYSSVRRPDIYAMVYDAPDRRGTDILCRHSVRPGNYQQDTGTGLAHNDKGQIVFVSGHVDATNLDDNIEFAGVWWDSQLGN